MTFQVGFNSVLVLTNRLQVQSHRIVKTLANQKEKANPRKVLQREKARSSGSQRSKKVQIGSNCACDTKRGLVNWVTRANTPICVHTQ